MKNKIFFFLISIIFSTQEILADDNIYHTVQPESSSKRNYFNNLRFGEFKDYAVVTANDYATKIGYRVIEEGGTVADATVGIQLALGLVEPQSSGLGGGLFVTYYDYKSKKTYSFLGRETAPKNLNQEIFLDSNKKPKKFFDAAIGGASVGVPGTLHALYRFHKEYGKLKWRRIVNLVLELSYKGFVPPNRLVNALKKEKYLFEINPKSIYRSVLIDKSKIFHNHKYSETLEKVSSGIVEFYNGKISKNIVKEVNNSNNPGNLSLTDIKNYNSEKEESFCFKLKNKYQICGPNLPSSGTLCIVQSLIIFESLLNEKKIKLDKYYLEEILEILNFVYFLRDSQLADPRFVEIDLQKLVDEDFLLKNYSKFKKNKSPLVTKNLDEILSSTTHFSAVDKYKNVVSVTSSIESSFGSRLFVDGFFLNNQLTDFTFNVYGKEGNLLKNRPEPEKRPLSSMAPLIVFNENDDFLLSIGSPGGKAIISYIFKSLIDIFYLKLEIKETIQNPNYIRIKNKTFVESSNLKEKIRGKSSVRNLTSGLAIIKKKKNGYSVGADYRRDGTTRGN